MLTLTQARSLALSLPEAIEAPHFDASAFKVKTKIFATLGEATGRMVVKLTPDQQALLTTTQSGAFAAVPGRWGNFGWTQVSLANADAATLRHALSLAYRNVAPKAFAARLDAP